MSKEDKSKVNSVVEMINDNDPCKYYENYYNSLK